MPLILQHRIFPQDLKNNPKIYYIFGDNEMRKGFGGQARTCRGKVNAIGIATKIAPSMSEGSFWSDDDYDRCTKIIDKDLKLVKELLSQGRIVIYPSDGIGTGLSALPERCPKIYQYLVQQINFLKENY